MRVPRICYLGLHGWEGKGCGLLAPDTRLALPKIRSSVIKAVSMVPGVWVEDKEHAFTVHYGGVPEPEVQRARSLIDRIVRPYVQSFRIEPGHNVWEVLP